MVGGSRLALPGGGDVRPPGLPARREVDSLRSPLGAMTTRAHTLVEPDDGALRSPLGAMTTNEEDRRIEETITLRSPLGAMTTRIPKFSRAPGPVVIPAGGDDDRPSRARGSA